MSMKNEYDDRSNRMKVILRMIRFRQLRLLLPLLIIEKSLHPIMLQRSTSPAPVPEKYTQERYMITSTETVTPRESPVPVKFIFSLGSVSPVHLTVGLAATRKTAVVDSSNKLPSNTVADKTVKPMNGTMKTTGTVKRHTHIKNIMISLPYNKD